MPTIDPKKKFTDAERDSIIRQTLLFQLQKIDRVMTTFPILEVRGVTDDKAPAGYTSGVDIFINWAWVDSVKSDEDLLCLYGLNYHELSHVILTPRLRGEFYKQLQGINLEYCFNLMEDWRIETHFASLFDSASRYFNVMVRRLLLDDHQLRKRDPEDEWVNFTLTMGRFYLDPAIRLRHERLARQKLKGSSRRMELEAMKPHAIQQIEEHLRLTEEKWQRPGLKADMLKLLDLKGDDRVNEMLKIAREFCGRRWHTTDPLVNRKGIEMVKRMVLLLPLELEDGIPAAGLPKAGNYDKGGKLGVDMPVHNQPDELVDEDFQDIGSEVAQEIIKDDEEKYERLKSTVQELDDLDEDEDEGDEEDDEPEDDEDPDDEEESDEDDDELDEDEESEDESDGGYGNTPGEPDPPPQIIIDPTQRLDEDNEETPPDASDQEKDRPDGHLTAGAGKGENDGRKKAEILAQLTSEELAEIDRVFRDAGVMDRFLTEDIEKILQEPATQRDVRSVREVIAEALGENLDLDATLDTEFKQVPAAILLQRDRMRNQLLEIQSLLEGTWRDEQPVGKVNLRRWVNAPVGQRGASFRSWVKEEIDEAGMEMVVLLDRSSSMASAMDHASQICWMVASAVQAIDGRVHVISFSDPGREEVLLSPAKRLQAGEYQTFGSYGGTNAAEALKLALKVMKSSNMPNRLMCCITDGGFTDLSRSVPVMHQLNAAGVETVLMLMGLHMERDRRGAKHVVHVNDLNRAAVELKVMIKKVGETVAQRVAEARGFYLD